MKKMMLVLSIVVMVGVAQASLLVFDNADFHDGFNGWGIGGDVAFSDGGGYGVMDGIAGGWGVLVATDAGIPLASLGVSAGDTITVEMDMILLGGAGNPGIKIESWGGGGHISNSGDINGAITSEWATYSWDYTIAAGADALKFVPLWGGGASVGYDNLSIVPEPATMALMGLGGLMLRRKK